MSSGVPDHLRPAACLALALVLVTPTWAVERQSLSGHVPAAEPRLQPAGRMPSAGRLTLAISLPLRNQDALALLLDQLYDPASPQYRHYLSPEQFTEQFGPNKEDYEALIGFAKAQGLAVTATHLNRTLLDVSGAVADIERVFQVTMRVYQHPTEARTFHAPDIEPSLDLAVPVLHISGLNNLSQPRRTVHSMSSDGTLAVPATGGSGPGGSFWGQDFRAAYVPGVTLTGTGQSVALFELSGYYASDVTDYESLTGLPNVPLKNVLIDGFDGARTSYANFEVALDIEMAICMAPGLSQVIVYEGQDGVASAAIDVLNRIATDNAAKQISSSWGLTIDATTDQIFKQYAAQGQSFFYASGDWGAYPGNFVADDPFITTVGGTELRTSGPGGGWLSESVWNAGYSLGDDKSLGSGGGISPTYSIPRWQQGISMVANHGSATRRNSPDVAMVADNIWLLSDNGYARQSGGTSAAAPLWAGFIALANQLAETKGQPSVGFINPAIYALGQGPGYNSVFHDITVGNNTTTASPNNFFAVPGYDLCTGWGTPAGSNLLYALALPERLQITPGTNFMASGPVGGPFTPKAQGYSLTNAGASALDWMIGIEASWLDASTSSGTLLPGAPAATVTLSVNAAAISLSPGAHTTMVWFTNVTEGSVQSRAFTLAVVTVPAILQGPVDQVVPEEATATFTVKTGSNGLLFYAWNRDGSFLRDDGRITGSATSTLTINDVSAADAGTYGVFVDNEIGVTSSGTAILTVSASPPIILASPVDQAVLPGAGATFTVGAVGTQPLSYQWQSHGTNLISGGNDKTLTLQNVSEADAGAYAVIVSNALGSVTNAGAMLRVTSVAMPGATLDTIYSFRNASDGGNPSAPLVQAANGNLYGTANSGGANRAGTVFRISTNGTLTTLHAFTGGNDGSVPRAGLALAADGNFYGTTSDGGANNSGTVFRMTVNGALSTLHTFSGGSGSGYYPTAQLLQAADGNFYGTTYSGGGSGSGTLFKMTPSGTFTSLLDFSGAADGANPRGALLQSHDGNLYGVTKNGGTASLSGTVFKITTAGILTTLLEFERTNSYSPRAGLVLGSDGNFYGTTSYGGDYSVGTVFRMTPAGLLTTLHSFNVSNDGQWPQAELVEGKDGYFYGTTYGGGAYGEGTVFKMGINGALTTLLHFDGFNGANPSAPLVQATDGSFYGTTLNGGANGFGAVFRLTVQTLELNIAFSSGNVILSWPSWAADLRLQQNSDLITSNWTAVTTQPVVTDLQNQVKLAPPATGNIFYRLTH